MLDESVTEGAIFFYIRDHPCLTTPCGFLSCLPSALDQHHEAPVPHPRHFDMVFVMATIGCGAVEMKVTVPSPLARLSRQG